MSLNPIAIAFMTLCRPHVPHMKKDNLEHGHLYQLTTHLLQPLHLKTYLSLRWMVPGLPCSFIDNIKPFPLFRQATFIIRTQCNQPSLFTGEVMMPTARLSLCIDRDYRYFHALGKDLIDLGDCLPHGGQHFC